MNRLRTIALITIGSIAFLGCEGAGSEDEAESHPLLQASNDTPDVVFNGNEDHMIGLAAAQQMMAAFRDENPDEAYGWYFGKEAVERLINQNGAVGLRIYGGINPDGEFTPVLMAVSADGNDINGIGLEKALEDSVIILEMAVPCPPYCCTDC